jgi:hypothetical protein
MPSMYCTAQHALYYQHALDGVSGAAPPGSKVCSRESRAAQARARMHRIIMHRAEAMPAPQLPEGMLRGWVALNPALRTGA